MQQQPRHQSTRLSIYTNDSHMLNALPLFPLSKRQRAALSISSQNILHPTSCPPSFSSIAHSNRDNLYDESLASLFQRVVQIARRALGNLALVGVIARVTDRTGAGLRRVVRRVLLDVGRGERRRNDRELNGGNTEVRGGRCRISRVGKLLLSNVRRPPAYGPTIRFRVHADTPYTWKIRRET